ncbi:MAG: RNA polymerase sigma factor [Anaerolineae bacterium]|nr:MAG: RNA polymerase sigma factor [Anaerolineae bacterium]
MVQSPSDRELVIALQSGDLDALGQLYDRHRRLVYRTAFAITGDAEAAADLLQDVFLRLHRFAHRIDPRRPVEPWLYRMTANLAYSWLKRRKRWLQPLDGVMEWFQGTQRKRTLQQRVEHSAEWERLRLAMLKLPPQQRIVVVMYYINELSLQEIAEVLEIPVGTVKSRLHYGRQALRKTLGLEGKVLNEATYEFT